MITEKILTFVNFTPLLLKIYIIGNLVMRTNFLQVHLSLNFWSFLVSFSVEFKPTSFNSRFSNLDHHSNQNWSIIIEYYWALLWLMSAVDQKMVNGLTGRKIARSCSICDALLMWHTKLGVFPLRQVLGIFMPVQPLYDNYFCKGDPFPVKNLLLIWASYQIFGKIC